MEQADLIIAKMIELFGEDNIYSEQMPKCFEQQINMAKWMVDIDNKPKDIIVI